MHAQFSARVGVFLSNHPNFNVVTTASAEGLFASTFWADYLASCYYSPFPFLDFLTYLFGKEDGRNKNPSPFTI